jgi:hypothetical protein
LPVAAKTDLEDVGDDQCLDGLADQIASQAEAGRELLLRRQS